MPLLLLANPVCQNPDCYSASVQVGILFMGEKPWESEQNQFSKYLHSSSMKGGLEPRSSLFCDLHRAQLQSSTALSPSTEISWKHTIDYSKNSLIVLAFVAQKAKKADRLQCSFNFHSTRWGMFQWHDQIIDAKPEWVLLRPSLFVLYFAPKTQLTHINMVLTLLCKDIFKSCLLKQRYQPI